MGPPNSPTAVVDPELRVIGAKVRHMSIMNLIYSWIVFCPDRIFALPQRLRVIDAGIMPFVVTVNTNGPTIMIGERGAEFVLETWRSYIKNNHYYFPKGG